MVGDMVLPADDRGEHRGDLLLTCERMLLWPRVAAGAGVALLGLLVRSVSPAAMELVGGWMAATSFVAWVQLARPGDSRKIAAGTTAADLLASLAVLGALGATPDGTGVVLFPLLGFELVLEGGLWGVGGAVGGVAAAIAVRMGIRVIGFGLPPRPGALLLMSAATVVLAALALTLRAAEQRHRELERELSELLGAASVVYDHGAPGAPAAVDEMVRLRPAGAGAGAVGPGGAAGEAGPPPSAPPGGGAGALAAAVGVSLTRREREVLVLLAAGVADAEVARRLGLSQGTVRVHVSNAMRKLNATDREQALRAAGLELIPPADADAQERRDVDDTTTRRSLDSGGEPERPAQGA